MPRKLPDGVTYELDFYCGSCSNCSGLACARFKVPNIKKDYTFEDITKVYGHRQVFDKVVDPKRNPKG